MKDALKKQTECIDGKCHLWGSGWICDRCGKFRSDVEEAKKALRKGKRK